ncbi:uncharacterized protein K489DRAFT_318029 [Dissoconium aciculare CBS 342.82]|uniref:Coenzyme Q-binding protein COQ10 START domain-containing protein n=1 Tax=Dissoconium aciculare CBS 342.82 TaxID=1314786 RepID=A0A6J3M724_9PEZI|nr:uncharacterized protein K489DRAFT_318029 [Dissoconium aciculare CBS 342.82]KAF1823324.1 hypothetical protein K489DRAFT_318029 [Dissoconium aciculare CBS 342.82]
MSNTHSEVWPPSQGLATPTVSHRDAVLTTTGSVRIDAPAAKVFETLLNVGDYESWNTWIPKVTIKSQPEGQSESDAKLHLNTLFIFHVIMDAAKPQSDTPTELRMSDISTPDHPSDYVSGELLSEKHGFTADSSRVYRMAWKSEGGFVSKGLKAERFHEIVPTGEHSCEVRTWEVMGGVLAYTVRWLYAKTLREKFVIWCQDLKKKCEE